MEVQGGQDGAAEKTKRTKRGRWTPEQRHEIVAASLVAGASINEVAQRFGIRPNLLTAWRRRQTRDTAVTKYKAKSEQSELLKAVLEIQKLLELLAEPAIAQRDAKLRSELRQLVGTSVPKQKSVFLMNGERTQVQIRGETSVNQGHLSTLVSNLNKAKLLVGDAKLPKLAISIPPNFFESDADSE